MKICIHCNLEKSLSDFGQYKKRSGEIAYRNVCKLCKNKQDKGVKIENKSIKENIGVDNKINNFDSLESILDSKKIKFEQMIETLSKLDFDSVFSLIDKKDEILSLVNLNLLNSDNAENKIKKSITISESTHKRILQITRNSNLNYSNVIDTLLRKALEDM